MAHQAYFDGTGAALGSLLTAAGHSVRVLLAGTCERPLFDHLLACRRRGLRVELMLRDGAANRQTALAWERLRAQGVALHWLSTPCLSEWPHNLCIVDQSCLISGTWQWTETSLCAVCLLVESAPPPAWLAQCEALLAAFLTRSVPADTAHSQAVGSSQLQLRAADGGDAQQRAWALPLWQMHAQAWDDEIAETQRQMALFDSQQDRQIGQLLHDYLDLKRQYLAQQVAGRADSGTQQQARQAQQEYDHYQTGRSQRDAEFADLSGPPPNAEQQAEIRQLYRKLAMVCHPDRVPGPDQQQALARFQELQQCYQRSDLPRLQQLQQLLEAAGASDLARPGAAAPAPGAAADAADAAQLAAMRHAISRHQQQRHTLMQSATWRTLSTQPNWSLWFDQQAQYLQTEIQRYQAALADPSGVAVPSMPAACQAPCTP
ncbi:MAG: DnaJ domain-containing protein [Rhodoferax sp.]